MNNSGTDISLCYHSSPFLTGSFPQAAKIETVAVFDSVEFVERRAHFDQLRRRA
jgi:hypothetical protein